MSEMIKPTSINFKELVRNSNTTLSLDLQSKIVDKLNETFSEQEQHWYVANLYMYMNYHPTDDYPINLEHVFKMIGFANKGNAMKTIKSNFVENEDYKIALFHMEKRKNEGGFNKETVMLNIDTFKNLCMIAKTERGKEIRKYYVKLENIYNEIIKEELEENKKIIEEQNEKNYQVEAQNVLLQIELSEKEKTINVLTKKTNKFKPGESVYIFCSSHDNKNIYKIGRTKNCNDREYTHKTATFDGEIVHQVMCSNSSVLERVCHFILDKYRLAIRREWFSCDLNTLTNAVEYAKLILDSNIDFENGDLLSKTKSFLETIKQNTNTSNNKNTKQDNILFNNKENQNNNDNINENIHTNIDENKVSFTELNIKDYVNNPNDFDKFINDCCEINQDYSISYMELKNQYKIWSKSANHKQLKMMIEYLKKHFRSTMKKTNPLVSTSKLTYFFNGIKIKDELYNFDISTKHKIIEKYLYDNCQRSPGYRVTINEMFIDFEQYCKNKYNFDVSYYHKEKIKAYFDTMFIRLRKGYTVTKIYYQILPHLILIKKN